ncbi:nuclear transport factor 2 family protein [Streptomyces sp. NPDC004134]|uniref:nuclear transport factor 2 family protein n=1 Tax=Streptomyces sp. NPDC004134 TaxID=3364691 RepID=UPI0036931432
MRARINGRLATATAALIAVAAIAIAVTGTANAGPETGTKGQTREFVRALEHKDLETITELTHREATLTLPLSFTGNREDAARFTGKDQVLGYVQGVFKTMGKIDFTGVRVSTTPDGNTSFVQAAGNFTTADGRPYENDYIFRYDWKNGRLVHIEEYGNPITFCNVIGSPAC